MVGTVQKIILLFVVLALPACSAVDNTFGSFFKSDKKEELAGERETVLARDTSLDPDQQLSPKAIKMEDEVPEADWVASGGTAQNWGGNPMLAAEPAKIWQKNIGAGTSRNFRLIARPVAVEDKVFAADSRGKVTAFAAADGTKLWETETRPIEVDQDAMVGGMTIEGDKIFVATGYGEVLALGIDNGNILWRQKVELPVRSAPTASDGRVFVTNISNVTFGLNAADGAFLWRHVGAAESTAMLGGASPGVLGDLVVVGHSTGDIFALRAQNGRMVWTDTLTRMAAIGGATTMNAMRASPMLVRGGVFVASVGGPLTAISGRTGERVWERDIGTAFTPALSGNTMYVLDKNNELYAMLGPSGRILWRVQLPVREDENDPDSDKILWAGPVLAGGKLYLTNNQKKLVQVSPFSGSIASEIDLPGPALQPPIVARKRLFVLTEGGDLIAFQ